MWVILIPSPPIPRDDKKFIGVLMQCANKLISKDIDMPPPEWTKDFIVPGENTLTDEISNIQNQITDLTKNKEGLEIKRNSLTELKGLLYESGKRLEEITIAALKLLGFEADRRQKDDMEHDVIMVSPEGRGIAEIEGKDNDAIRIDKLDQLSRVVDEDFSLSGKFKEGILIGNHYRFRHPDEREAPFTQKVLISAERKNFGLLTTTELFKAAVRIRENPEDDEYKKTCRNTILNSNGKYGTPIKF